MKHKCPKKKLIRKLAGMSWLIREIQKRISRETAKKFLKIGNAYMGMGADLAEALAGAIVELRPFLKANMKKIAYALQREADSIRRFLV